MKTFPPKSEPKFEPKSDHQLSEVIEPLASYICSSDRPRAALLSALSVLFDEVQATNRTALIHTWRLRADALGLAG
jgi:hypothetical protein